MNSDEALFSSKNVKIATMKLKYRKGGPYNSALYWKTFEAKY